MDDRHDDEQQACETAEAGMSDEAIEQLKRRRFQERVQRVLAVMQEERIDWRGVPHVTPDGRIGVRILPVEMARS